MDGCAEQHCLCAGDWESFPYCVYGQPAPTISNIKMLSGEQLMELCLALSECSSWPGAGTSHRQMDLLWGVHPGKRQKSCELQPTFDKARVGSQCASKMGFILFFRHFSIL